MLYPERPRNPKLQRGQVISKGLVGAWLFGEGGGDTVRESVYGNQPGTLNGVVWQSGALGISPYFANNTYIDTNEPDRYQFAGGCFTTVMRLKPGAIATHHGFVSCLNYGGNTGYLARSDNANTYKIVIGNSLYALAAGGPINTSIWLNLTITWISNGSVSSYYNGLYIASVGIKPIADSGRNLYIGKEQGVGYSYVGGWDSLLIYNRILTSNEIRALSHDIYLPFRASPMNLKAVAAAGTTTIHLSWTDNSEHEDDFSLERRTDGGAWSEIDTPAADDESYADNGIATGHTYSYRIKAQSATLGDSGWSNIATVTV